jgi:hypothetical protein
MEIEPFVKLIEIFKSYGYSDREAVEEAKAERRQQHEWAVEAKLAEGMLCIM